MKRSGNLDFLRRKSKHFQPPRRCPRRVAAMICILHFEVARRDFSFPA
jgi:hypothetical protein